MPTDYYLGWAIVRERGFWKGFRGAEWMSTSGPLLGLLQAIEYRQA